jgi:hypothetical protein
VPDEPVTDHKPVPGPEYWSWRCRICDEPVEDHRYPINPAVILILGLVLAFLGLVVLLNMR